MSWKNAGLTNFNSVQSLYAAQFIITHRLPNWPTRSQAILKYVADAPLSRLTEAYLEKVQAASTAVLGNLMDAPMPLAAAPAFSDEVDLVSSSAADLLSPPLAVDPSYRFAVNNSVGSQFVHIISSRQAWERPRPGRTNCGWDFLANQAPLFVSLPPLMRQCGKCASHPTWARLAEEPSDSD